MDPALSTNARPEIIPLWPDGAPGSEDWDQEEQESVLPPSLKVIRNVAQPTLTAFVLSTGSSAPGRISPRRCGRPSLTAAGWRNR